jgi:twitching motility protein PilI
MQSDELKAFAPDDIARQFGYPATEADVKTEAVFGIRIASIGLLVSARSYCEVLDKIPVNALPNVHPWVAGIINLRGNLIPVFDLRTLFNETAAVDNNKRRLFAIDRGDKAVALWIDGFPDIKDRLTLKPLSTLPELPELLQRFVITGYTQNGQVWLDVKFAELFKVLGRHQYAAIEVAS